MIQERERNSRLTESKRKREKIEERAVPDAKRGKVLFMDGKYEEAAKLFYASAANGDAEAAFDYAYCLQFGYGASPNPSRARSFYCFAKERIGEANYNLAVMYLHGDGVSRDYRKAYSFMYDAARAGIIEAQLYLGVAHTMGTMFEPDITAITRIPYHTPILRDASLAIEGDVPDMEDDEEKRIRAVRFDPRTAFEWFRIAARHDSDYVEGLAVQSKYLYARCFVDGLGTDYDRKRAEDLMLVAASEGSPDALAFLEENAPYRLPELKEKGKLANIRKIERLPEGTS